MYNPGRVALVACGCLREFTNCYHTWNLFDNQHNYVFTWDTDYLTVPYEDKPRTMKTKIEELRECKKNKYIKDYEIFVEPPELKQYYGKKSVFLWAQLDSYLSYDYDYVLITRPDNKFFLTNSTTSYTFPKENEIHVSWVDEVNKKICDGEFLMTRSTYKTFSEIYKFCDNYGTSMVSTHLLLYDFFKEKNLQVTSKFEDLATSLIFRPSTKTINNSTKIDVRNNIMTNFIIQKKHAITENTPTAVLIIANNFLSGETRDLLTKNLPDRDHLDKYIFFESYSEDIGITKIKNFEKNYNISFCNVITLNYS